MKMPAWLEQLPTLLWCCGLCMSGAQTGITNACLVQVEQIIAGWNGVYGDSWLTACATLDEWPMQVWPRGC